MQRASLSRIAVAATATAALAAAAAPAVATRPASQAEIDGIVKAVDAYTTLRGYSDNRYVVDDIAISSASASPLYARAQVDPLPRFRRTTPAPTLLLTRPVVAGAPWQVLDAGDRFCTDTRVPAAVILDLFRQRCGGTGGGGGAKALTRTIASARVGPLRAVLSATRGSTRGKTVRATVHLTIFRNGVEIAQPQLGPSNAYVWSQVRRPRSGFVTINPSVGYVGAQVLRSPVSLYAPYQFRVTSRGLWQQVASPATP